MWRRLHFWHSVLVFLKKKITLGFLICQHTVIGFHSNVRFQIQRLVVFLQYYLDFDFRYELVHGTAFKSLKRKTQCTKTELSIRILLQDSTFPKISVYALFRRIICRGYVRRRSPLSMTSANRLISCVLFLSALLHHVLLFWSQDTHHISLSAANRHRRYYNGNGPALPPRTWLSFFFFLFFFSLFTMDDCRSPGGMQAGVRITQKKRDTPAITLSLRCRRLLDGNDWLLLDAMDAVDWSKSGRVNGVA